MFLAGDDASAKDKVSSLMDQLGFFGIDLGELKAGGQLFRTPGGPLSIHNLIKRG
jgi:predicted dinucleotide-binding enzyme